MNNNIIEETINLLDELTYQYGKDWHYHTKSNIISNKLKSLNIALNNFGCELDKFNNEVKQIQRTAGIFLINKNNELLICHVTNSNPSIWSIPKGLIDGNEKPIDAAIRETKEETNICLKDFTIINYLLSVKYKHKNKILYPFVLFEVDNKFVFDDFIIKCNSFVNNEFPEVDDFKWVSLDDAKKYIHETQIKCLSEIKELLNFRDNVVKS